MTHRIQVYIGDLGERKWVTLMTGNYDEMLQAYKSIQSIVRDQRAVTLQKRGWVNG